ncbi:DNA/RNA non-specific endonuclease [bacterium]|nr:DNA/RNA non-specific endonuclease [bacterium]
MGDDFTMTLGNIGGNNFLPVINNQIAESSQAGHVSSQNGSGDVFVRSNGYDLSQERMFAKAGHLFQSSQTGAINQSGEIEIDEVSMYPNRSGYDENFLGVRLPMPTLGASIQDKVAYRTDKPGETELTYTNFSVVMNKDRRQCFYTICNIDGATHKNVKRSGSWTIDGRIPREYQLGNEAYSGNNIDRGHMVRRLDPCWGNDANLANNDTFSYCNSALQHGQLNQKEWLELENHVLNSATSKDQRMSVITGPIFSDDDPKFDNHGKIKPPTQIPMKFFKTVVWKDEQTGQLKSASFILSQEDIINGDHSLFKGKKSGGFTPGRFEVYQVPLSQVEELTDLHFGNLGDISTQAVKLTAENDYKPVGL